MNKRGFTLLEVLLALGLVSAVLLAVTMAIDVHLRLLDSGRTHVEEAQLARALLRRIADDLRGAVLYDPIKADELIAGVPVSAEDVGDMVEGAGGRIPEGLDLDEEMPEDEDTERTVNLAEAEESLPEPGLFGNSYELQVDTSRLPRIDQFDGMSLDENELADLVSDVKTVTYYVIEDTSSLTYGEQPTGGLVRRERDRATTAWADEMGLSGEFEDASEPIAPEVTSIEFRYHDGTEWHDEWDSIEQGGLPVAVDVAIAIAARSGQKRSSRTRSTLGRSDETTTRDLLYRLLVHLPVAEPTDGEEMSEDFDSDMESEEEPDSSSDGGPPDQGGSGR